MLSPFIQLIDQYLFCSRDSLANHFMLNEDGQPGNSSLVYAPSNMWNVVGMVEETEETCNGKSFLNCFLQNREKSSSIDDLAEFIECKQGKDYSGWLKDRQKYRKWKYEKQKALMWKKKKKTWKLKGKKI